MNWEKELEEISIGGQSEYFGRYLSEHPGEVPDVIKAISNSRSVIAWRAGWVLDNFARKHPIAIKPYIKELTEILISTPHNGVRRHLTRILSDIDPRQIEDGRVVDLCFSWLINPKIPVAVKANSMSIIANLTKIYPELAQELEIIINDAYEEETAGYKSRSRKIMQQIKGKPVVDLAD